MERDYTECDYKARLANEQHFYSQSSPFPSAQAPKAPQTTRALHGIFDQQRDTRYLLAAKGYQME